MAIKMGNGKNYLTVVERMDKMIAELDSSNYSLETEVTLDSGVVIVKATLTLNFMAITDTQPDFNGAVQRKYVGHALGELGKHKTLEATETHAIGRCLASAGYHGGEFASANEMESWEQSNKEGTAFDKAKSKPVNLKDVEVKLPKTEAIIDRITEGPKVGKIVQDDMKIFFGKNKGSMMSECDTKYLKWLSGSSGKENLEKWLKNDDGTPNYEKINLLQKTADYFLYKKTGEEAVTF